MQIKSQPRKTKKPLKTPKKGLKSQASEYGEISILKMGNINLKRRVVTDPYRARLYIPPDAITFLNAIGLQLGVTWDEALRGVIDQHRASNDPVTGLALFIPALN